MWADLGMPSGQAYTKGVRMVKTCVGTDFCRFGTQDSTSAGIEMERRFEQLFTPHKVKMAAVGCPRNCAEATVKDIGLIGVEGGWQVVVGGAAGKSVRKADLLTTVETTEQALEASELFFQYYREHANYLERTYDFVERLGIEKVRKETVYAPERRARSAARSAAQVKGARPRCLAGRNRAEDADAVHPAHPDRFGADNRMNAVHWVRVTPIENIPPREGRAVLIGDREIALFNLGPSMELGAGDRFLATDNQCPHQGGPLCDGIVTGSSVVCPLHAWKVNLANGQVERPTHGKDHCVTTYPVRVEDGVVLIGLPVGTRRVPRHEPEGVCPSRALADAARRAAVLRRQLHDLGAARAAGAIPARGPRAHGRRQQGLFTAIPLLGGSLFRPVLGMLADRIGGRRTGLIGMALTLVTLSLGWQFAQTSRALLRARFLPRPRRRQLRRRAAAGQPLVSAEYQGLAMGIAGAGNSGTLLATLFAPRLAERFGWAATFGVAMVPVAAVLPAVCVAREGQSRRRPAPTTLRAYGAVLREPDTLWLSFLYSLTFGGFVGFASFLTTFFHEQYHVSRVTAGDFTTMVVVSGSLLRPVGGWLADRVGGYRLLVLLLAGFAVCIGAVAMLPSVGVAVALLFVGIGLLGMGNGAVFQLVPQRFPDRMGIVTGVVGAAGGLGGFFLPSMLGAVRELTGSYAPGLFGCAAGVRCGNRGAARAGRALVPAMARRRDQAGRRLFLSQRAQWRTPSARPNRDFMDTHTARYRTVMTSENFDGDFDVRDKTEIDVLHEIGSRIAAADPLHAVLGRVVDFVSSIVPCDSCFMYVLEEDELVLRASKTPHPDVIDRLKLRVGQGITGWVAEHRQPVAVGQHAFKDPRFQTFNELPEDRYEAFLSVPVLSRGKLVGVINLQHRQPHDYSRQDIQLISTIGFPGRRRDRDGAARGREHPALRAARNAEDRRARQGDPPARPRRHRGRGLSHHPAAEPAAAQVEEGNRRSHHPR